MHATGGTVQPFSYFAPRSLDEATALLRDADARVLAGGTDLIVQMRTGRVRPARVVDVKRIPELRALSVGPQEIVVGAAVPAVEIRENAELRRILPGVVEAIALIGSWQIQGRATAGGNLCNASPAADSVPALIAAGARATIAGPGGTRSLPVESFVEAPGKSALRPGEMLVDLRIPRPAGRSADAYLRLIPRSEMDIAVVGAGVALALDAGGRCSAARVALGAVAPTPLLVGEAARALVGSALDEAALARAGAAASAACLPIDDKRGTAEYRRKVAGVLVRRAAAIAASRARGL
jgi:carbon-monoxide dehydrogenase medium subunit